jgi:outer membrane protein assembly factor BamB
MWSRRVRGARDIAYISAYANDISVIGSTVAGERYQYLNAANGEVQYSNDANYPVFFTTHTWYIIQPRSRLRAVASNNNTLLWERRFDTETFNYSSVYFAPILDNGIIIGRTGEGVGKIYALDSASGHLLWRSEDIVYGNVAVSQGVTFFLNEQAELKAIDSKTGQVLAIVTFEPETPQERLTQGGRIYNVAAKGDIVVVYLGDSRQLFAFRFVR